MRYGLGCVRSYESVVGKVMKNMRFEIGGRIASLPVIYPEFDNVLNNSKEELSGCMRQQEDPELVADLDFSANEVSCFY